MLNVHVCMCICVCHADPGRDPFDTSDFSFEPAADAVPITDNATFDAFSSRFDSSQQRQADAGGSHDPFASPAHLAGKAADESGAGFDSFDPFSTAHIKPPKNTPIKVQREVSNDSFSSDDDDEQENIKVVIKAKMRDTGAAGRNALPIAPLLPPPPKTPTKLVREVETYQQQEYVGYDAVLKAKRIAAAEKAIERVEETPVPALGERATKRKDSAGSPSTPLFDEDTSQPLEEYPVKYTGSGWEMYIRHPAKKKLTANRFWKKIYVKVTENAETSVIQLFNKPEDNDPFQELPLQTSYSLSEIQSQVLLIACIAYTVC